MQRSLVLSLVVVLAGIWVYALPPGTDDEISARLEPFGMLCRTGDDCGVTVAGADAKPLSGKAVYDQFCFICHAAGVGGAPLFGDTEVWALRAAKGMDQLLATTLSGLNAMPPMGTCMACSDDELSAAVTYMIEQAQ